MPTPEVPDLDALWAPQSVAVVGASDNPARFGGRPIQFLKEAGFAGPIYPINPGRDLVQGLRAYASLDAVEGPVDCAIISVQTEAVLDEVRACARKGVRACIIFSAGFAELGGPGQSLQDEIVAIARGAGMRVLGPNCMGLLNAHAGFYPTFASALEDGIPAPGRIGVVSQSGGYGGYVMRHFLMRGLGLAYWITSGNESDVDVGEALHWMASRDEVDVIVAYMEGLRSSEHFIAGLRLARARRKPVIVMKVGRTAEGSEAAKSHTASLTGADDVYDAVFREYGVRRAETTEELLDLAQAASRGRLPAGRRVGIVSISGGVGVQMADYVADHQLVLAPVPQATQDALRRLVPACSPRNPIDMTGLVTADRHLLRDAMKLVLECRAFDAVVVFIGITAIAPSMGEPIRQAIMDACQGHSDQLLFVSLTASPEMVRDYEESGFFAFEDPARAIRALGALDFFRESFESAPAIAPASAGPAWPAGMTAPFNEVKAKALLGACAIGTPRECLVANPAEAEAAAAGIGGPVAVKVVSADIPHKTEYGGVRLGLATPAEAGAAVRAMMEQIPSLLPAARIDGYLVSEMVSGGIETILGMHTDPVFGPVVTVGLGGVHVELFHDVASKVAPVSVEDAHAMIAGLKSYPLLAGYRGKPGHDVAALAGAVARFSALVADPGAACDSFEINPLLVRPGEGGVVALDAAIAAP